MKLIRMLIGLPLVIVATMLPYSAIFPMFFYFLGCFLGLIGGYFLTRIFKYEYDGIFWILVGLPFYFFSMHPFSFIWLAELGIGGFEMIIARWVSCLLSICMLFASIRTN